MRLTRYLAFVLLFGMGMAGLQYYTREFRRTRDSGTFKPYANAFGILLSVGLIILAIIGVFSALLGMSTE